MRVLALDSAASGCGAAVLQDEAVLAQRYEAMARGQDARLLPLLAETLAAANLTYPALERIVVLRGPGSFTGLRIGLAAARGLGLALGLPVVGLDRFALYRAAFAARAPLLVVLDSRRDEFFCCLYAAGGAGNSFLATAATLAAHDRAGLTVCGDAAGQLVWQQAVCCALPEPEVVLAARQAQKLDPAAHPPLPLYLRAPDVSHGPAPAVEEAEWSA